MIKLESFLAPLWGAFYFRVILNLKNSTYSSIAYNSESTKAWININLYY